MIALALLLAAAPAVEAKPKVLVLDFRDDGVGESAVHIIRDNLVAQLSKNGSFDVISPEDMRRVLDVEAEKRQLTGCSDESCLVELAGALGAQLMLYGTAGKLGDIVVVNVSLFDARSGKSVGRETVQAKTLEDLPGPLRDAGDRLIASLGGGGGGLSGVGWTGVGVLVAGVGTGVISGIIAVANNPSPGDGRTFAEKKAALPARDLSAGIALGGAGLAVVGAGVLVAGIALE